MFLLAKMSTTTNSLILVGSLACLVFGAIVIWLFILFKNKKSKIKEDNFETTLTKFQIYRFWQYAAFIMLILALFVVGIIFSVISIENLIKS